MEESKGYEVIKEDLEVKIDMRDSPKDRIKAVRQHFSHILSKLPSEEAAAALDALMIENFVTNCPEPDLQTFLALRALSYMALSRYFKSGALMPCQGSA